MHNMIKREVQTYGSSKSIDYNIHMKDCGSTMHTYNYAHVAMHTH